MKIIKRDGKIVDFDESKIKIAIGKANNEVKGREKATKEQIQEIVDYINRVINSFDVNLFAQKAAVVAIEDEEFINKVIEKGMKYL